MQVIQYKQGLRKPDKNTFSTQSSKRDTQIQTDQNFKIERQKYLEQRFNRRKQIKNIKKQQFGSSSSESETSLEQNKLKPKIFQNHELDKQKQKSPPKATNQEQQFHAKHQAYIRDRLARKQQVIEQRRKEFGYSSSDSDMSLEKNQITTKTTPNIVETKPTIQQQIGQKQKLQVQQLSPVKRSLGSESNQNTKGLILIRQVVQGKEKVTETKKLTVLVQSKKNQQWIEETMVIEKRKIKFINQNLELMIGYVSKVKLFFTKIAKGHFKIKISYKDDDYYLGVSTDRNIENLDELVEQKLIQIGFEPKKNESTIFPNYMNIKDAPLHLKNTAIVYGNILKKSQVLGNWETRFVYITQKEIGSSKRPHGKPSMVIPAQSISEIWTRFDIQNNNLLNIKIMYNSSTKTQFGIPISCFTDTINWLYSFYRIISKKD